MEAELVERPSVTVGTALNHATLAVSWSILSGVSNHGLISSGLDVQRTGLLANSSEDTTFSPKDDLPPRSCWPRARERYNEYSKSPLAKTMPCSSEGAVIWRSSPP